jgi:hypothetical protein
MNDSSQRWKAIGSAAILVMLVQGCAARTAPTHPISLQACEPENHCTLTGKLTLLSGAPAGAAILSVGSQCAKLALPDEFFVDPLRERWHGRVVTVEGRAFQQPDASDNSIILMWYSEKDRRLSTGVCDDGPGVYVETMSAGSQMFWPARPR